MNKNLEAFRESVNAIQYLGTDSKETFESCLAKLSKTARAIDGCDHKLHLIEHKVQAAKIVGWLALKRMATTDYTKRTEIWVEIDKMSAAVTDMIRQLDEEIGRK